MFSSRSLQVGSDEDEAESEAVADGDDDPMDADDDDEEVDEEDDADVSGTDGASPVGEGSSLMASPGSDVDDL